MIHASLVGFTDAWREFKIGVGNIRPILDSCAENIVQYDGTEINYSDLSLSVRYQQALTKGSSAH